MEHCALQNIVQFGSYINLHNIILHGSKTEIHNAEFVT
jgi:hypothetical protein